jgi:hypothetical protein
MGAGKPFESYNNNENRNIKTRTKIIKGFFIRMAAVACVFP